MGSSERVRGKNFEYRVVNIAKKHGLTARRVVLSGSAEEKGDVEIQGLRFECKYRSSGFTTLRGWVNKAVGQGLGGVIVGGARSKPLLVMPAREFFVLLRRINNEGGI